MSRISWGAVVALCLAATLSASAHAGQYRIGLCFNNLNDVFNIRVVDAARKYVDERPDLRMEVADAQHDILKQYDQIDTFITEGFDILVVSIVDSSGVEPITRRARSAGIPLLYVLFDPYPGQDIPEGQIGYVGSPTTEGGEMEMEFIGKALGGKGNIGILIGMLTNEAAFSRTEGVKNVIKSTYPGIKILSEEAGNWQRDIGLSITENWITTYGNDLCAVIANNDEMALGACLALERNNRTDVLVAGIDATPDALRALEAGKLAVTVFQNAEEIGRRGMEVAYEILQGNVPDKRVWIPLELVTQENYVKYKQMYSEMGLW